MFKRSQSVGSKRCWAACAGAAMLLGLGAAPARAENFFWLDQRGSTSGPGITSSIFLTNDNVATVDAFLSGQAVKAVKIETPLSQQTVNAIFNKYNIDYTFLDYEGANAVAQVTATVQQIRSTGLTGTALAAGRSYVSNFAFSPAGMDPSKPAGLTGIGSAGFAATGLNMVSDDLYPGSPFYKSPASGDSTAPNIRSALFTQPLTRLSMTSASLPAGVKAVPYVNRFNNWANTALDSDHDSSNGYQFVTSNQLPSRGDFQAQLLHYRLRGASGFHGLDGGVVGYTPEQFQQDITTGWNGTPQFAPLFAAPDAQIATLDTRVKTDGVSKSIESAGVVFSGMYSLSLNKLSLLLSNMDESAHILTLPTRIGGKTLGGDFRLEAGSHEILQYGGTGTQWSLIDIAPAFVSSDADRGGVGVPEPTALAGFGAAMMLLRRRQRA